MKNIAVSIFMVLVSVFGFSQGDTTSNLPYLFTKCKSESNELSNKFAMPLSFHENSISKFESQVTEYFSVDNYSVYVSSYTKNKETIDYVWVEIFDDTTENSVFIPFCVLDEMEQIRNLKNEYDIVFNYMKID
jgi:hypothetical protein